MRELTAKAVSHDETISYERRTWGTETSQYLQERKSNETLRVVASEIGIGQRFRIMKEE